MTEPSQPRHLPTQRTQQTQQPPPSGPLLPATHATPLLTSFTTFLTLAIHSLLYHRHLYPSRTFLLARAYNLPVQQSRHAGVCRWINDAVSAVGHQLAKATVERVVFVVHAAKSFEVLERWVFDVGTFPEWGVDEGVSERVEEEEGGEVVWTDVDEGLRGGLRRVAYAAEKMEKPPEGSRFSLAVELRDEAAAPIAHPQHWIPSQPDSRPASKKKPAKETPEKTTTPVRAVRAGPLFFECWIEQPKNKPEPPQAPSVIFEPPKQEASRTSMGPPPKTTNKASASHPGKDSGKSNASS